MNVLLPNPVVPSQRRENRLDGTTARLRTTNDGRATANHFIADQIERECKNSTFLWPRTWQFRNMRFTADEAVPNSTAQTTQAHEKATFPCSIFLFPLAYGAISGVIVGSTCSDIEALCQRGLSLLDFAIAAPSAAFIAHQLFSYLRGRRRIQSSPVTLDDKGFIALNMIILAAAAASVASMSREASNGRFCR